MASSCHWHRTTQGLVSCPGRLSVVHRPPVEHRAPDHHLTRDRHRGVFRRRGHFAEVGRDCEHIAVDLLNDGVVRPAQPGSVLGDGLEHAAARRWASC
jgi:hypothetical protein